MRKVKDRMKVKLRKLASLALTAAMLCSGLTAAAEETVNLALGVVPTQSMVSSATGSLSAVTDGIKGSGDANTAWTVRGDYHNTTSTPPALIFDLGAECSISKVAVTGSTNYTSAQPYYALPKNYDVAYSADGSGWTTAAEVRNNTSYESISEFPAVAARYWRIDVLLETTSADERARICEVEIFGTKETSGGEDAEKPSVSMTEQTAELNEGETILLSAQASCESSEVTAVEFYDGTKKLANAALTDGLWSAPASDLSAGEHFITARAVTAAGGSAESDSMRTRVHSGSYSNIALGKIVNADHGITSDSWPDALVDGIKNQGSGQYKWIASAAYAKGAYAEIDLASGIDNTFLIKSITVYSAYADVSTTDLLTDFTLSYYDGNDWIDAAEVTGAGSVYTYGFDTAVPAVKVRLTSNMTKTFRVRELEVEGILYKTPAVTVVLPENNACTVYEDAVQIKLSAEDMGAGLAGAEVLLNGRTIEAQTVKDGGEYIVTVTGLEAGDSRIIVRIYDQNGRYGETEVITVTYRRSEDFIEQLHACKTAAEVGALVQQNKELLNLSGEDYTDLDAYGKIYEKILDNKENITTAAEFIKIFETEAAIIKLNSASASECIDIIRTSLTEVSLDEFDSLSEDIQAAVCEQIAAADITDMAQLEKLLSVQAALQTIKFTAWTNLEAVIGKYSSRLNLTDYSTYQDFVPQRTEAANRYIASKKNTDGMNSAEGFNEIFSDAVAAGRNYKITTGGSGGGGGGGGSSSGIRISGQTTAGSQIAENLNPYNDVDKSNSSWAAIMYLTQKGVMLGDGDGTFAPERLLKREEFARILIDGFFGADENAVTTFTDVQESDWFYAYVATGQQMGLIAGFEQDRFGSGEYVTREQMAALCYRAAAAAGKGFADDGESAVPSDEEMISSWAYYPITILRRNGIFGGEELRPLDAATRAEAAQLLYEIMLMEE